MVIAGVIAKLKISLSQSLSSHKQRFCQTGTQQSPAISEHPQQVLACGECSPADEGQHPSSKDLAALAVPRLPVQQLMVVHSGLP